MKKVILIEKISAVFTNPSVVVGPSALIAVAVVIHLGAAFRTSDHFQSSSELSSSRSWLKRHSLHVSSLSSFKQPHTEHFHILSHQDYFK